jgi:photosystem II stability/assembly factor-like uncharacterized protein
MFKSLVLISSFVILSCITSFGQGDWEKIKTPTDYNLLKVCYFDSLHCWVAGDSGVIMFSSDQGVTWEIQNSGVSNYIHDIFFLNDSLGWAVAFELENFNLRSKILSTSNGGQNWQVANYRALNIILNTIFFQDTLNGWIGGDPFELSFTNDGGLSWSPANVDTGSFAYFPINKIRFSSSMFGFAVGGAIDVAGVVWRTNDAGASWKAYGIAPDKFDDFIFLDSTTVLSLSADIERYYPIGVLKFDLQKNFWTYNELNKYGRITSLSRRTNEEVWGTLGCDTSFIVSKDTGKTWDFIPTNDSLCIFAIGFSDSLNGIAVGEAGYIFKYVPDSVVSVNDLQAQVPSSFVLEQNFPNPFNPGTVIQYTIGSRQFVSIKVYDVLGNEIASLVNEEKPPGSYSLQFTIEDISTSQTGSQLSSGVYFYQLKASNFVETKKMLLLK